MTKITEYVFNRFPREMTVKNEKTLNRIDWIGPNITSPQNRFIMGATALATQPWIDYNNDKVDEKTRMMSVARTLAKIIVGTTVGVLVRHGAIKLVERGCNKPLGNGAKNWASVFVPDNVNFEKELNDSIKKHRNTIGTVIGTAIGIVTNFVIDMPLTKLLTNKFIHHFEGKEKDSERSEK